MQARAGEIEAALAASEAELDRQESVSRAANQVRNFYHLSSESLASPSGMCKIKWTVYVRFRLSLFCS